MSGRTKIAGLIAAAWLGLGGCYHAPGGNQYVPNVEKAKQIRAELAKTATGSADVAQNQAKRSGWGTLKGTFVVVGSPPPQGTLNITKDPAVCQPGGAPVLAGNIVVAPETGGLANVVLFAQGLGGDNVNESARPGKGPDVIFDQKACVFLTHVQKMNVGQKLKVINSDPIPITHNTKINFQQNPPFNQTIGPGQSVVVEAPRPEEAPVSVECSIHPWMRGYLMDHENGYVAVTAPDGSFEIANLPAGIDLRIKLWHETLKKFGDIEINGKKTPLKAGALPVRLEPNKTTTLEIRIPASAFH